MNITLALVVIHFFLFVYTFRFQRTTLTLSRQHLGQGLSKYQGILTPNWMGALGWLQTILYISAIILIFVNYSWYYALGYLIISQIGYSLFDGITPFPSYQYCFKIIKNHLQKEVSSARNEEAKISLEKVLENVLNSEKELKN